MIFNPIVPKMEPTTYISSLAVGSSVWCEVNGARTELLIVQQGNPDTSLYDASCDGTWCLFKGIYEKCMWSNNNDNDYKTSSIHNYLNGEFLNLFKSDFKNIIKQVKIPYVDGAGYSSVKYGPNGLPTKMFLLSGYEVGWTSSDNQYLPDDGAKLDYFLEGHTLISDSKRIAKYNSSATLWWLRSSYLGEINIAWDVNAGGSTGQGTVISDNAGIRPAFILPFDIKIDKDNNIIAPPSEPQEFKYYWNESPNLTEAYIEIEQDIHFYYAEDAYVDFTHILIDSTDVVGHLLTQITYEKDTGGTTVYDSDTGWENDIDRYISFYSKPSGDLLTFLQANATPIVE